MNNFKIVFYRNIKGQDKDLYTQLKDSGYFINQYRDTNNKGVISVVKKSIFNKPGKQNIENLIDLGFIELNINSFLLLSKPVQYYEKLINILKKYLVKGVSNEEKNIVTEFEDKSSIKLCNNNNVDMFKELRLCYESKRPSIQNHNSLVDRTILDFKDKGIFLEKTDNELYMDGKFDLDNANFYVEQCSKRNYNLIIEKWKIEQLSLLNDKPTLFLFGDIKNDFYIWSFELLKIVTLIKDYLINNEYTIPSRFKIIISDGIKEKVIGFKPYKLLFEEMKIDFKRL